ncbi:MAG: monovalent cation/H+ antiporter subunit A, partial [Steroidobacteraceae bacterium]
IVLIPFVGARLAAFRPAKARAAASWLSGLVTVACTALIVSLYWDVSAADVVLRERLAWAPQLGLEIYLRMDGYAWLFAFLVSLMGVLVVLYARYYMSPQDPVPRFFSFLMAFMGAMLGTVLSGNLIQLVVFWEHTSLTYFVLIAYWYHRAEARRGARMALIVTATGGMCLLLGIVWLGSIAGSYDLDHVLLAGATIRAHEHYPILLTLILLGALTKSAQFPFHFWLPNAMEAPTPVSAYLHSATMVKAGVFLLARLWPVLAGTSQWFWILCTVGLCSLLLGAAAALFQRDLKGVLAYSTISHLGLITLLLGMNSPLALVAAVFHMMNHATFKASLFMAAGIVDHETGTRDMRRLSGLSGAMPVTATVALVACAAMAGVPLLNGFLSKEMFFAETIFAGQGMLTRIGLPAAATVASMFSVAYSARFVHSVFFGPRAGDLPRVPHEPTRGMLAPSALLVLACLLVGVLPEQTIGPSLDLAVRSILGAQTPEFSLKLWHGFTTPVFMSVLALGGGGLMYRWLLRHKARALAATQWRPPVDGKRAFDTLMVLMARTSERLMSLISSRRLQAQLLLIVVVAFASALVPLLGQTVTEGRRVPMHFDAVFAALWLVGGACAVGAAAQAKYHRLAALIMVGVAGLATCLTFAWFSAPDLALTQIGVEVVTTVLLLLGLRWMPRRVQINELQRKSPKARARRARDLMMAVAVGAGMAALVFAIITRPAVEVLAPFFLDRALPEGGGHNVVNVILVDFRGFDTLGEITVLGAVALTIYALLRRFRPAPESRSVPRAQREDAAREALTSGDGLPEDYLRIPAAIGRMLLPVAGMISVYFLLRGHNAPGGGFVGGLVMATGIIVQYMTSGVLWVESRLRIHPQYWIAAGQLAAGAAGISAWFFRAQFLTSIEWHGTLPLLGTLHLSSVLLFDVGVYMVVVGATVLMLIAIAHQSLRRPRKVLSPDEQEEIPVISTQEAEH